MEEFIVIGTHGGDYRIEKEGDVYRMYRYGAGWTKPGQHVLTYVSDPDNGNDNVYGDLFKPGVSSLCELRTLLNAVQTINPVKFEENRVFKSLRGQSTT